MPFLAHDAARVQRCGGGEEGRQMTGDVSTPAGGGSPASGAPATTRSVLVVDDDDMLREVARVSLEMVGGWQVSTAASGAEAVRVAAAEQPDAQIGRAHV